MKRVRLGWKPAGTVSCVSLILAVAGVSFTVSGIEASPVQPVSLARSQEQEAGPSGTEALRRGQVIVESACSICHELDLVEGERLSREDWGYIIQAMLVNGSDLSDREIPLVLDYLSAAFPAESEAAAEEN